MAKVQRRGSQVSTMVLGLALLGVFIDLLVVFVGRALPDAAGMALLALQPLTWVAPAAILATRTGFVRSVAASATVTTIQGLLLMALIVVMAVVEGHPHGAVQTVGLVAWLGVGGGLWIAALAVVVGLVSGIVGWLASQGWGAIARR